MMGILMGATAEDAFLSLASRLNRLERQMTPEERDRFADLAVRNTPAQLARTLLAPFDADGIADKARQDHALPSDAEPSEAQIAAAQQDLMRYAASLLTGELVDYADNVRKVHEQIVDTVNLDRVIFAGWDQQARDQAAEIVQDFQSFIAAHQNEITALRIFYNQPYQRRGITYRMIQEVLTLLKTEKPNLAPLRVWQAYQQVEAVESSSPVSELVALVSLIRRVVEIDPTLTPFAATVNRNFQQWVFQKQAGAAPKFNEEQMELPDDSGGADPAADAERLYRYVVLSGARGLGV